MKRNYFHKIVGIVALFIYSQFVNAQTYTASFIQGQSANAADVTAWDNFRASLTAGSYCRLEFTGSLDQGQGKLCTDPATILNIANTLRTAGTGQFTFGGLTWYVGGCGSNTELAVNQTICNCVSPGFSIRPGIGVGNSNWGGCNTATCGGPTQTLTLTFITSAPVLANIITSDLVVCAGSFGSYKVAPAQGNPVYNWTLPVGWTLVSGGGTDSIYVQYGNNSGNVTVNATTACGTGNTVTQAVTVHPFTIITFAPIPQTCTSSGADLLNYASPGGGVYSGTGVSNGYFDPLAAGPGTHTITYTYTNNFNCQTVASQAVTVFPGPVVTQGTFPSYCKSGAPVTLYGGNPAGGTYSGPGVIGGVFDPGAAGAGMHNIVYAYASLNGCIGRDTVTITVTSPVVGFNPVPSLCVNTPTFIMNYGTPSGGTYSGAGMVNNYSFDASVAGPGSHVITYTYQDNVTGCIDTDVQTVVVNSLPAVTFVPPAGVCQNAAPFALTGGSPAGGVYSGTGVSNGVLDPSAFGAGQVTYTYTNPNTGCSNASVQNVAITPVPGVAPPITGTPTVCQGQSNVIYSITAIPGATGYNWVVPPGVTIIGGNNTNQVTLAFSNISVSGSITVSATTNCGNGAVSPSYTVTVNPLPIAGFTYVINGGVATFSNTSLYATGFTWDFGDGSPTSNSVSPVHVFPANNTYSVSLIASNSCRTDTSIQQLAVVSGVGVDEAVNGQTVSVYPNPTRGELNIQLKGASMNSLQIKLMSANGQLVHNETINNFTGSYIKTLDLGKEAKGIYFLQFISEEQVITKKVILE